MAVSSASVTVSTSATALNQADTDDNPGKTGQSILVRNVGANTIYLGGSGVTTVNGYPLGVGSDVAVQLAPNETLYGIVAASTESARVLVQGV